MPYEIRPTCSHCKKQLTIKLNIVDKLQARIKYLEKELESNNAAQTLKNDNNNNFFGLFGAYSFLHR
jgi:hypothetical protein